MVVCSVYGLVACCLLDMSSSAWFIRSLVPTDVQHLLHIQTVAYGAGLQESGAVFARRLACAHQCSLGIARAGDGDGNSDDRLLAYLAAYWSEFGKVTPLDGDFSVPPAHGRVLYIHDIAVLPELAGQGAAQRLLEQLFAQARAQQVRQAALVAVQGSQPFWQRLGFAPYMLTNAAQLQHLHSYGPGAVFMTAAL